MRAPAQRLDDLFRRTTQLITSIGTTMYMHQLLL